MPPTSSPIRDLLLAVGLGLAIAAVAFTIAGRLPPAITQESYRDVWFQAAAGSILSQAGDRLHGKHGRNNIHPFYSLAVHPGTQLLHRGLGLEPWRALRLLTAGVAAFTIGGLFLAFRILGCRLLDAVLFVLLFAVSATSMFFLGLPETFPFGAMSLVAALVLLAWSERRTVAASWYVLVNLATVGFVTTNWMAGLLVTLVRNRLRATVRIIVTMLLISAALLAMVKVIYPASRFVLDVADEMTFVNHPDSGGPHYIVLSFLYHTVLAPAIHLVKNPNNVPGMPSTIMSMQLSWPGSAVSWGVLPAVAWSALLAAGIWALYALDSLPRVRLVVAALLLGQLTLHLVYGEETFLYSLHFAVLFIMLPALASLTRARPLVIILVVLLIPLLAINNLGQFDRAVATFQQLEAIATSASPASETDR